VTLVLECIKPATVFGYIGAGDVDHGVEQGHGFGTATSVPRSAAI